MVITISGLLCHGSQCATCNHSSQLELDYLSPQVGTNLYHSAQYRINGQLLLTLTKDIPPNATVILTFCLENPFTGQSPPDMFVESSGIVFPKVQMQKGRKGAAPLSVVGLDVGRIGQSTPAQLTVNTITVTLKMLASIPAGANIAIVGLYGLKTPSAFVTLQNAVPDHPYNSSEFAGSEVETSATSYFGSQGMWNMSTGQLSFTLAQEINYDTFYILSFTLQNGAVGQESLNLQISVIDASRTILVANLTTGGGNSAILKIARFLTANMHQSNAIPSSMNNITISFSVNSVVKLQDQAFFVFTDFKSVTASARQGTFAITDIEGYNATKYFGSNGTVTSNGTLMFPIQKDILPYFEYAFIFEVQNPDRGQDSPAMTIECTGFRISATAMTLGAGIEAPLRVAGLRTASIGQSTSCASSVNTLTVTLNFYMTVPYGRPSTQTASPQSTNTSTNASSTNHSSNAYNSWNATTAVLICDNSTCAGACHRECASLNGSSESAVASCMLGCGVAPSAGIDPNTTLIRIVGWAGLDSSSTFAILQYTRGGNDDGGSGNGNTSGTIGTSPFVSFFNGSSSELLLRIREGEQLAGGVDHVIEIEVKNGEDGQESQILIASGEGAARMTSKPVVGAPYDAAPLVISGVRVGLVSQSSPLASGNNTIHLSLSFFTFVKNGTMITISGLEETQTASTPQLPLQTSTSAFSDTGAWDQGMGSLVVEVVRTMAPWYESVQSFTFAFQVVNPAEGRSPPNVTFTATYAGVCTRNNVASNVLILPIRLTHAAGNAAALRIAGFQLLQMHQQTASMNVENLLFLDMNSFVTIKRGSIITMEGITCHRCGCVKCCRLYVHEIQVKSASSQEVGTTLWSYLVDAANEFIVFRETKTTESALLQGQSIELDLVVDFEAEVTYSFSFRMQNNDCGQEPLPSLKLKVQSGADSSVYDLVETPLLPVELGMRHAAPFLINYFPSMLVKQNTTATLAVNNIGISFSTRAPLSNMTVVKVLGLFESLSPTGPIPLFGPDSSEFEEAHWNKEEGELSLIWGRNGSDANRVYNIDCSLQNPRNHQPSAATMMTALDPVAVTTPEETDKGFGVEAPLLINEFIHLLVYQGTPAPGKLNNITVRFQTTTNIYVASNTKITLRGLTLTETLDSETFPVAVEGGYQIFNTSSSWTQSSGTLVLSAIGHIRSDRTYYLIFSVTNPIEAQLPARVYISSTGVDTTEVEIPRANGTRAPLVVLVQLTKKFAWQSTPSVNVRNTIVVTLASVYGMVVQPDMKITIKGLTGSATPDELNGAVSCASDSALSDSPSGNQTLGSCVMDWNQALGQLVVTSSDVLSVSSGDNFVLSFNLTNPVSTQESPEISIKIDKILTSWTILDKPEDRGRMHAPLQIAGYTSAFLNQSTPSQLAVNTLIVLFTLQTNLLEGTLVRISGLQGPTTPSADIDISSVGKQLNGTDTINASSIMGIQANWNSTAGVLTITTVLETSNEYSYTIFFDLSNPGYVGQDGPTDISIRSDGATAMSRTQCDGGPGITEPLLVADFLVKHIRQSSASTKVDNTILVTFSTRAPLTFGSKITLQGLTGPITPDGAVQIVTSDVAYLAQSAAWQGAQGQIVVNVLQTTVARHKYSFSFVLTNPNDGQDSPVVNISSTGIVIMPTAMVRADGNFAPLLIARFVIANISQSAPGQDIDNLLTIWVSTNVNIFQTCPQPPQNPVLGECSSIRLSGLGGSATVSGVLPVISRGAVLSSSTDWSRDSSSMQIVFTSNLHERTLLQFQFNLRNPPNLNEVQDVNVELRGTITSRAYVVDKGQNAAGPLLVIGILQKDIRQNTPSVRALNTITLVFKTSISLPKNFSLTLTGLTGSVTAQSLGSAYISISSFPGNLTGNCNFSLNDDSGNISGIGNGATISDDTASMVCQEGIFSDIGLWNWAASSLILKTNAETVGMEAYTLSFELQNGEVGQLSPEISIHSNDPRYRLSPVLMDKGRRNAAPMLIASFATKHIMQRTPSASSDNILIVTLESTADLLNGTRITISGFNGSDTPDDHVLRINDTSAFGTGMDVINQSHPFGETGSWSKENGTMIITVCQSERFLDSNGTFIGNVTTPVMEGNRLHSFSFVLRNGGEYQEAPSISIESSGTAITKTEMDYGLFNEAPLLIAGFRSLVIGQSTASQSTSSFDTINSITVTFRTNVELKGAEDCKLTISGLVGTLGPKGENATIPILVKGRIRREGLTKPLDTYDFGVPCPCLVSGGRGCFCGAWNSVYGTMVIAMEALTVSVLGAEYRVRFEIINPMQGRDAADINVSGGGITITRVSAQNGPGNAAPLLIAGFLVKNIGQSTPGATSDNTISVTILTRAVLLIGTKVTVSGLTGSLTIDATLDVAGNGTVIFGTSGDWTRRTGIFVVSAQKDSDAASTYVYTFVVRNPSEGQPAPLIFIESSGATVINRTRADVGEGNRNPMGIAQWRPTASDIGQIIPHASAMNTIQVTLGVSAALPSGAKITISGLTGSDTPSGPIPMIDKGIQFVSLLHQFRTPLGPYWNRERGELVLTFEKESKYKQIYLFAFNLKNPATMQDSPVVWVEVGGSILVPAQKMTKAEGNKAPMKIAGFSKKEIYQSTPGLSDLNTITVNLVSNIDYRVVLDVDQNSFHTEVRTMMIRITNLKGAASPTSLLSLTLKNVAAQRCLPLTAFWNQSTSNLFIAIEQGKNIVADAEMEFSFQLLNPDEPQLAPIVSIGADGIVSHVQLSDYAQATLASTTQMVVRVDLSRDSPLQIAGFCVRWIGQSTVSQTFRSFVQNTISVSIVPTVGFRPAEHQSITISGLTGSLTPDNSRLPVRVRSEVLTAPKATNPGRCCEVCGVGNLNSASHVLGVNGRWNQTTGSLGLDVLQGGLPYIMYVIEFELVNSRNGQDAILKEDAVISSSGIEVAARSFELGVPQCTAWSCTTPTYGNNAPMLVADFLAADISQSTPSANASNTISFMFSTRASLVRNTALTIFGLTGSSTRETLLNLTGNATAVFGAGANFDGSTGVLVLLVQSASLPDAMYTVEFQLTNAPNGQSSPQVLVETNGTVIIGTTEVISAVGNKAPMLVADFLVKKIGQNDSSQTALNTISVTIATRAQLITGSNITISGFTQGVYSLLPVLPLFGMSSMVMPGETQSGNANASPTATSSVSSTIAPVTTPLSWVSGRWNQAKAWIVVTIDHDVDPGNLYTFSFHVTNPGSIQKSPPIYIESSGIAISRIQMESASGNLAPGTVSGFVSTLISQSNPNADEQNTLSIDFSINVNLPPGHVLKISNLAGAIPREAFDSIPLSMESTVFHPKATWATAASVLSITNIENLKSFMLYRFNVTLTNPSAGQASPSVRAEIKGPIKVAITTMSKAVDLKSPLSILSVFTVAKLSQSTAVPGADNTLTISLVSRDLLSAAAGIDITISGLIGTTNDGTAGACGSSCLSILNTETSDETCNYQNSSNWTKLTGLLILKVAGDIPANTSCSLQFVLTNPLCAQFSPEVVMTAGPILFLPRMVQPGALNSAPLLIAGFLTASINQSNSFMGNDNRLFVSFSSTVGLLVEDVSVLRVSGLTGSMTFSTNGLAICDQGCAANDDFEAVERCCSEKLGLSNTNNNRRMGISGSWDQALGILEVPIIQSTLPGTTYMFSFVLENSRSPRDSVPYVVVAGSGTYIPGFNASLGEGNRAPMMVAGWAVKAIGQLFPASNAVNTISVTIASQAQLHKEIVGGLNIKGLLGSSTPAGIVSVETTGPFAKTAQWHPKNGTLAFVLTASMMPSVSYVLNVSLQNQLLGRDASTGITLEAVDPQGLVLFPAILMQAAPGNKAPFLIADFLQKSISQSTMAALAENIITITLSTRSSLEGLYKTSVTLKGLTGSGTLGANVKILLAPPDSPFGPYCRWYQGTGTLVLKVVDGDTVAGQPYVLSFVLRNGPTMQMARNVSVWADYQNYLALRFYGPWTAKSLMNNGANLRAPFLIAGFDILNIAQTSAVFGSQNRLFLNLSTNVDVNATEFPALRLMIAGLAGVETPSGTISVSLVDGMSGESRNLSGAWDKAVTDLTIPLPNAYDLLKSTIYKISFGIQNGIYSQESPNITIKIVGTGFDISPTLVPTMAGDTAALKIVGVIDKTIAQSTASVGATNTITVTISASGAILPVTEIRIDGLIGATTPSGNIKVSCEANPTLFQEVGVWNQTMGTIGFWVQKEIASYVTFVIEFNLTNPLRGQLSPNVGIAAYKEDILPIWRRELMSKASGNGAPLLVAAFSTKHISQSTVSASSTNTITMTIEMYSALLLHEAATISISGILGSTTPSGTVTVHSPNGTSFTSVFGTSAVWHQGNGSLILTLISDSAEGETYIFSFDVMNPSDGRNATVVDIVSTGTQSSLHRMDSLPGNLAPMLVADFFTKSVGQSEVGQGATNIITVTLQMRASLSTGTTVTISGLRGSVVADSSTIPVLTIKSPSSNAGHFSSKGSWTRLDGTMRLFVVDATEPLADYVLAFALRNPFVGQAATMPVLVSSSGTVVIHARPMSKSPNNASPLLVAGFLIARVYQNEAESVVYVTDNAIGVPPDRPNTVTIEFVTTCSLVANSHLVLRNLIGSPTQSNSSIALSCNPVQVLSSQGNWDRDAGMLSIGVVADTSAHVTYICSVTLNGPVQAQMPPTLSLEVNSTRISQVVPDTTGGQKRPFGLEVWCAPYSKPVSGMVYPETSVMSPGEVIVICEQGYMLKVAALRKNSERPVCRGDGTWSTTDLVCEKVVGALFSWGSNLKGQLGDGSSVQRLVPTPVAPGTIAGDVSLVVGGEAHSLAITANGTLYTWGSNQFGQLGYGPIGGNKMTPSKLEFGVPLTFQMASAGQKHSVVLGLDGSVWCFGAADSGQLGNGAVNDAVFTPTRPQLPAGTTASYVAAGGAHVLAVASGGTKIFAWGSNSRGQLGDGSTVSKSTPVLVSTQPGGVVRVVAGMFHSLALLKRCAALHFFVCLLYWALC